MSDECLTKLCSICGKAIVGGNYYCPDCKLRICLYCGLQLPNTDYPPKCPKCGKRLL